MFIDYYFTLHYYSDYTTVIIGTEERKNGRTLFRKGPADKLHYVLLYILVIRCKVFLIIPVKLDYLAPN